jgi:hypothetical protein
MDHRTLQNFDTQCDLSCRQLHWQEYMSHYDMTIVYIPGEDNTIIDTLSRVTAGVFPGETSTFNTPGIHATLSITADPSILCDIQLGYKQDEFCKKLILASSSTPGVSTSNGL